MQCLVWTLTTSLQESFLGTGTFLKKEKALDKFEYLTFQVTTLFCLTCVVGAYYLQLPYKVWNESQTRKVYCTLKDTFLHFFCSSCPSLWGSYRRPQFARYPVFTGEDDADWGYRRHWRLSSLLPYPLERCNYPMWDLPRVIKWIK